jgi:hypothetical protein
MPGRHPVHGRPEDEIQRHLGVDVRIQSELKDSWEPGPGYADTWGPYYSAQFPPTKVTPSINFKRKGSGVNVVRRHWDQREELRAAYEAEHGSDPENWPHRHAGIVIDVVQFVAHAACLGCQWIDQPGNSMSDEGWREASAAVARRHESSHGEFRGEPDQ